MHENVLEIVTFNSASGISPDALATAGAAIHPWLVDQPGFVRRSLARADDGGWVDCVTWSSMETAHTAAASMRSAPGAPAFLAAIDMSSVTVRHFRVAVDI